MFSSVINGELTFIVALECFLTAIVLGLVIAFIHFKTTKCSKNFAITLAILPLLVGAAIAMVNGSIGTGVAILGIFSLIRFRSIPGNAKEILSVFFTMAVGLAIGTGYLTYAVLITIVTSILIIVLTKTKFADSSNQERLVVVIPEDLDYEQEINPILKKHTKGYNLIKVKTVNLGSLYELTYNINVNNQRKALLDEIRVKNGNLKVMIESEYNYEEL